MSKELAQAAKARGNEAFTKGDFQTAVKEFTVAIENDPTDAIFYSNRSGAYTSLKQYQEALSDANKCIELKPDFVKGYGRKGAALFGLKQFDDAKNAYNDGLKIDGNNNQLKEGLEEVNKALSSNANNPMGQLFGPDMWVKLQSNPVTRGYLSDPAFLQKMKMLQTNPSAFGNLAGDPQVSQALGVILGLGTDAFKTAPGGRGFPGAGGPTGAGASASSSTGRTAGSGVHVHDDDEDEDMEDEHIDAQTKQREEQKKQQQQQQQQSAPKKEAEPAKGMTEEEKQAYEAKQTLLKKREAADVEKNIGNELYKKKDFEGAATHYNKAIEMEPTNIVYYNNLSAVYFEQKDYEKTIEICQRGIEATRDHLPNFKDVAKAYARIGSSYEKMGDIDRAIDALNKSLVEDYADKTKTQLKNLEALKKKRAEEAYIDPVKSEEHKQKGNELFNEGKFAEAISEYTEAIKRDPKNYKVYSNRAACYIKMMDWGRGLDDCEKCLAVDPKFVKAYIRKGKIQHFLKQYHKALATFDQALEIEPNNAETMEAKRATLIAIQSSDADPERAKQAMADPEIQQILRDPTINKVLQEMQENPQQGAAAMRDPDIRKKIEKLIAAGVLQVK